VTLVICAHGTRSADGRAAVRSVVDAVSERVGEPVLEAYVDVHGPTLGDTLRPGMTVVPLFLAAGYHVHVDIAGAAARVGDVAVGDALGPSALLVDLLLDRLGEAGVGPHDAVVLGAAGSSDDRSDASVRRMAAALSGVLDRPVHVAYGAARLPSVPARVAELRTAGARRVVVASYLLATGHFHRLLLEAGADAVTAPLVSGGPANSGLVDPRLVDPRLVELVLHRAAEARGFCDRRGWRQHPAPDVGRSAVRALTA
jgi:sirohydrochlorin ferrochelatase